MTSPLYHLRLPRTAKRSAAGALACRRVGAKPGPQGPGRWVLASSSLRRRAQPPPRERSEPRPKRAGREPARGGRAAGCKEWPAVSFGAARGLSESSAAAQFSIGTGLESTSSSRTAMCSRAPTTTADPAVRLPASPTDHLNLDEPRRVPVERRVDTGALVSLELPSGNLRRVVGRGFGAVPRAASLRRHRGDDAGRGGSPQRRRDRPEPARAAGLRVIAKAFRWDSPRSRGGFLDWAPVVPRLRGT